MKKTETVYARIEPDVKEKAEEILADLGIPVSTAINIYYRQIIENRGLPMDVKLNIPNLPIYDEMNDEELAYELEKGYKDLEDGKVRPLEDVLKELNSKYGFEDINEKLGLWFIR